jgi:hypothetical protein
MTFVKGQVPHNKTEHIQKVCKCGKVFDVAPSYDRVKSCSMKCAKTGSTPWNKGKKCKSAWNKGLTGIWTGPANPMWKGGITKADKVERVRFRQTMQRQVFERDNYTCQICDQYGGNLQVDHIKRWSEYPEMRFDLSNCRTLCMACHYFITFKRKIPEGIVWGNGLNRGMTS